MFKIVIGQVSLRKMELYINKENMLGVRDMSEKNDELHIFSQKLFESVYITYRYSIFKYMNAIHVCFLQ